MAESIKVLVSEEEIVKRIKDLGAKISEDYAGKSVHLICVLKGCAPFMCELAKRITVPVSMDFMSVSSYGNNTSSSGIVKIAKDLDETLEGEQRDTENIFDSGDKIDLNLPECQRKLFRAVTAVGKPVILLLSTGSAIDLREADEKCNAILQTWYPGGRGGKSIAKVLFGDVSPAGKLPVTFYRSVEDLPDFCD